MILEWLRFGIAAMFTIAGVFTIFVSILGVFKFKFDLNRMHSASITDTLGLFFILFGIMIAHGISWATAKMLLIIVVMWLSSPVSSHFLSRLEIMTARDLEKHIVIEDKTGKGEKK